MVVTEETVRGGSYLCAFGISGRVVCKKSEYPRHLMWSLKLLFIFLYGYTLVISYRSISAGLPKVRCDPPTIYNPINNITFKDYPNRTYPRREMRYLLSINKELQLRIRLEVRLRNLQTNLNIDPDYTYRTKPSPWLRYLCVSRVQHGQMNRFMEDKENGDCWVLRPWWNVTYTWILCDRMCSNVQSELPFFIYTCVQGNYKRETFWTYCPQTKKFIHRKLLLPKCCFCKKLQCLLRPTPVSVHTKKT